MGKYTATAPHLQSRAGNEILIKFKHGKLGGVENLVAELSITFHAKDLEVNVATY